MTGEKEKGKRKFSSGGKGKRAWKAIHLGHSNPHIYGDTFAPVRGSAKRRGGEEKKNTRTQGREGGKYKTETTVNPPLTSPPGFVEEKKKKKKNSRSSIIWSK